LAQGGLRVVGEYTIIVVFVTFAEGASARFIIISPVKASLVDFVV
jgi:hypothetical protein